MNTKHADIIAKILITVVVVILVGLMIAWMCGLFKDKKQDLNSGTEKINSTTNAMADFDLLVYDGDTVSGDTLAQLIEDTVKKEPELSIAVRTLVNAGKSTPVTIYYNKALAAQNVINSSGNVTTLDQSNKSSDNYITPTANFIGEVLRDRNNEITGILFTQQK